MQCIFILRDSLSLTISLLCIKLSYEPYLTVSIYFCFCIHNFQNQNYTNLIRSSGGGLALRRDIPSRDASSFSVSSGSDVMRDDWAFPLAVYGSSNRGCKF